VPAFRLLAPDEPRDRQRVVSNNVVREGIRVHNLDLELLRIGVRDIESELLVEVGIDIVVDDLCFKGLPSADEFDIRVA